MGEETEFDEKGGRGAVEDESHSRVTVRRSSTEGGTDVAKQAQSVPGCADN